MDTSYLQTLQDELRFLRGRMKKLTGPRNRSLVQIMIDQVMRDIAVEKTRENNRKLEQSCERERCDSEIAANTCS